MLSRKKKKKKDVHEVMETWKHSGRITEGSKEYNVKKNLVNTIIPDLNYG